MTEQDLMTTIAAIITDMRRIEYDINDPMQIEKAIDAAIEMIERMEGELRLIAETDPIDAALDPQRAIRIARTALEKSK